MARFVTAFFTLMLLWPFAAAAKGYLPVHIEDNHSGAFYWIWCEIYPKEPHALILFDSHSDSGSVLQSDEVRKLASAPLSIRRKNAALWMERGAIQSFNWIEPLVPFPIARVRWVFPKKLKATKLRAKQAEVRDYLNMLEPVRPRQAPNYDLSGRYSITDFNHFKSSTESTCPIIVSMDLDYFMDLSEPDIPVAFEEAWQTVLSLPRLEGISFAISRPYLKSDAQANLLFKLALEKSLAIANARISFEPFARRGPDRSLMARAFHENRKALPEFRVEDVPREIRDLLLHDAFRISVHTEPERWTAMLDTWRREARPGPELVLESSKPVRFRQGTAFIQEGRPFRVKINALPEAARTAWFARRATRDRYNVTGQNKHFAVNCPGIIRTKRFPLPMLSGKRALDFADLKSLFDESTGFGQIELEALVCAASSCRRTNALTLARYKDETFPGRLTAAMNLPYIFGGPLVSGKQGPSLGSDCSSFIIGGIRANGSVFPDANPGRLLALLSDLGGISAFDENGFALQEDRKVPITQAMIDQGLIVHLGTHLAAVYEDKPPQGFLSEDDLVIHQLEGKAGIIPLKNLPRACRGFRLMAVPASCRGPL